MKFMIDQLAFAPVNLEETAQLLADMGLKDWVQDTVRAQGTVWGNIASNCALLSFNYEAFNGGISAPLNQPTELELLKYDHGEDWLGDDRPSVASHIGMHVTEQELNEWKEFFAARNIPVCQEVNTVSHTNPYLVNNGRRYHYCIFFTRPYFGLDTKFIVRIEREEP